MSSTATSGIRVAAIQMNCGNDMERNFLKIEELLAEARNRGVALALLPENSVFIGTADEDKLVHAEEPGTGPIQAFLADVARRYGLFLVAGSIPLRSTVPGKCYGASVAFDEEGRAVATYLKIHLFDVGIPDSVERYRESDTMDRGDEIVVVESPAGRLGLTICYDLRFPELYRELADKGATIFTVPAAFTRVTGDAHWRSLLRARAIENQAYVIAAGQHGVHPNGRTTHGHSMIVDPWGKVLAELDDGDGVIDAVVDAGAQVALRDEFPVLAHRRL
jgi:nitrilase